MPRRTPEAVNRPFQDQHPGARAQVRLCDHPACSARGEYRAPRGRDRLDDYYWFCLDHVRAYNRAWDYFAGMNAAEIEAERRRDITWQRPTWPFGGFTPGPDRTANARFRDDFGIFDEDEAEPEGRRRQWQQGESAHRRAAGDSEEERALAELDLDPPVSFAAIKHRYKELVKRLHPDVNGGDNSQEDRLKTVNRAYATLRAAYART